jgi:hypothetical protein
MQLLFNSAVALGDGVDAYPEEVHEVPEALALSLIQRGKAVLSEDGVPVQRKRVKK